MKLLFLSKRRPQGRDLLTRPYGRFYHLPRLLADRGHEVHLLLLSYQNDSPVSRRDGNLYWYSVALRPWGPAPYISQAAALAKRIRPDWVIGFSDVWYGILADWLASTHYSKFLIDAYDNYESYIPWAKPLHWAWRRSCRRADALCAAGPGLLDLITDKREAVCKAVVPMAADPVFSRLDRDESRHHLGLPNDIPLVGYCGSLYHNRGVENLFAAMKLLKAKHPDLKIVFSGRKQNGLEIPFDLAPHVIDLGYLADEKVPVLLNAMDVLLVINRPSDFGNYSYPAKLYEAMQCGVPIIATAAQGTEWILRDKPECLVSWDDPLGLADGVTKALSWARLDYPNAGSWVDSAQLFSQLLETGTHAQTKLNIHSIR